MELELEQRAIVAGIGLIWVAMFETAVGISGKTHPPSAERLFRCFEILNLREDSTAAEILADVLKAWIDPTGNWATGEGHTDTKAALDTALGRLYEIIDRTEEAVDAHTALLLDRVKQTGLDNLK
jgi:hypothetical protein